MPISLKDKVEEELHRLEGLGIITPIKHSQWAAPVVPVLKHNGSIRFCGDYRVTINQASKVDTYPLPRVEDLFAAMSGGKVFSRAGAHGPAGPALAGPLFNFYFKKFNCI